MRFGYLLIVMFATLSASAVDYDRIAKGEFTAKGIGALRSMNDGEFYTTLKGDKITKFSYKTGDAVSKIFEAEIQTTVNDYEFSADETKILLVTDQCPIYRHSFTANHLIYDIKSGVSTPLSSGTEQAAQLSPDGTKCAFVRDNNLFVVNLSTKVETQLTFDGKPSEIINGIPDWVYEEEYGFNRAYEWAPNSDMIAFYRFDEKRVKSYDMNVFGSNLYPDTYSFKYPKAGEENAIVEIFVADIKMGVLQKIDIGDQSDQYIPRIKWSPKSELAVMRLNRDQNNFDILFADPKNGKSKIIYNEKDDRYIERIDDESVTFIDNERFIIKSEKSGYAHIYLCNNSGEITPITTGEWDVISILGCDKDVVYYISAETSPLRRNLYSVKLNGKDKKRLTPLEGTYKIDFSKGFKYYISSFSNNKTPNIVTLHSANSKQIRVLEDNTGINSKELPAKEFFTFKTSEGIELNGYIIKPKNFDPSKKHPVFMTQYSGPGSQSVSDNWSIGWEYALLKEGYIIACVDGRGTGLRGAEFKKCTYKKLGHYEFIDQCEAAKYLETLPFVDVSRIGIYGWSYGGFMSLNCILKGGDIFKLAISVAPVTSWRFYDTIYTELYNGKPQDNAVGYDENSPLFFADGLQGKLLIAHGTADDNVHIQNTYRMIDELIKAGKDFEMHIYPDKNHSMFPGSRVHLMKRCINFVKENL